MKCLLRWEKQISSSKPKHSILKRWLLVWSLFVNFGYSLKLYSLFFPLLARHQGFPKQGKPSMVTSSSLALEEKGPTSAYRLPGWEPWLLWSARYESALTFVAMLCYCTESVCEWSQHEYMHVHFFFFFLEEPNCGSSMSNSNNQLPATRVHQLVNDSPKPCSFIHTSVIPPHQFTKLHFRLINTALHAYAHPRLHVFKQAYSHIIQPQVSNQWAQRCLSTWALKHRSPTSVRTKRPDR